MRLPTQNEELSDKQKFYKLLVTTISDNVSYQELPRNKQLKVACSICENVDKEFKRLFRDWKKPPINKRLYRGLSSGQRKSKRNDNGT